MTGPQDLIEKLTALRENRVRRKDLYDIIHDFGHANFTDAELEVARFLTDDDPSLRYIAISVLTLHWDMVKYRQQLEPILFGDPDAYVRQIAAACLGYLLRESRDRQATRLLLRKLRQTEETGLVRAAAYEALLDIWLPAFRRDEDRLSTLSDSVTKSLQEIERGLTLSKALEEAKLREDLETTRLRSEELKDLSEEQDWERRVNWELVAAIERGEVP